jgi:hypothetical protein
VIAEKFGIEQPAEKTERKDKQKRSYRSRAFCKQFRVIQIGILRVKAIAADVF